MKVLKRLLAMSLVVSIIAISLSAMPITASATSIEIGDYIRMGTYYGEPILWRCVDIDENGPLMLSDRILCIKAFDAAGDNMAGASKTSHARDRYGYRKSCGSNYWADSNIRTWLNSNATAGNVYYPCGNPPKESGMWSGYNEYDQEAGFLTNFTNAEKSAMKSVTQRQVLDAQEYDIGWYTSGNSSHGYSSSISSCEQNYDTAYAEYVTDGMFLLDCKQANKIYQNRGILGSNYHIAKPTKKCVENSEYKTSSLSDGKSWYYWLRSPNASGIGRSVRSVHSGGSVNYNNAYTGNYGVRPAFYLNLSSAIFKSGNGFSDTPYVISGNGNVTVGQSNSNITSSSSVTYNTDQQEVLDSLKIDVNDMLKNISVGSDTIKGPSITFLGKTFYLFEFDGKVSLDFKYLKAQAKVDADKKTVQILIGFKDLISSTANVGDDTQWKKSYREVKDLYTAITGKNSKVSGNQASQRFQNLRSDLQDFDANLCVKAKGKVAGFVELSYETGKMNCSAAGMILEASIGGELQGRVPAFPLAYVAMGVSASTKDTFTLDWASELSFKGDMNVAISTNVGIGLGKSTGNLATYIEAGLKGTLDTHIIVGTGKFKNTYDDWLTVALKANGYIKGALAGFLKGEKEIDIGTPLQLYPWNGLKTMSLMSLEDGDVSSEMIPIERDYLYQLSLMSVGEEEEIYRDNAVYDYNDPILAKLADGRIVMLWVDDDGTKNDLNKTSLCYSIYNGSTWSQTNTIFEDGTYNGSAKVVEKDGKVCILWAKASKAFADDANPEELINACELYYTEFDGESFTEPLRLTDNNSFETGYTFDSSDNNTKFMWIENTENDPFMISGSNVIKARDMLGNTETLATSEKTISEIQCAYADSGFHFAYVNMDEDTYRINIDNKKTIDGSNIQFYNGCLYYISDSQMYKYDFASDSSATCGIDGISNFYIMNDTVYSEFRNELKTYIYKSEYKDGKYTPLSRVTDYENYIRSFDVIRDNSGEDIYALNLVDIDDIKYTDSHLVVTKDTAIHDVVLEGVCYSANDIKPSNNAEFKFDVLNKSNETINNVKIEIKNKLGLVLHSENVSMTVNEGETASASVFYTLPQNISMTELTFSASAFTDDSTPEDNEYKISYGLADAVVSDLSVERTDSGAVLKGMVTNEGFSRLSNVNVYITDPADTSTQLDSTLLGNLAAGETVDFEMPVPEKYLKLEDRMTMNGLMAFVETTSEEASYGNNDDKVVFGDLSERNVALCDGTEIIDIISYKDFNSYIYRKEGQKFKGWHDNNGVLYSTIDSEPEEDLVLFAEFEECDDDFSVYKFTTQRTATGAKAQLILDYTNIDFQAYYGIFDENGALVACDIKNVSEGDETIEFEIGTELAKKYYQAKMFVWNTNLQPLMLPVTETLYLNERLVIDSVLESEHDYSTNCDKSFEYHYEGLCRSVEVTFSSETETEKDADYIYIYDENDKQIGCYTGTSLAGKTIVVPGKTVKIRLVSDSSLQAYGFKTEKIVVNR